MRIGYVAKHDSGGNDDEGAITHALESLGHSVSRLRERRGYKAHNIACDFLLFHHWTDFAALGSVRVPKVFWVFDLIDFPDSAVRQRCRQRVAWIAILTQMSDIGFMTDGDWVERDRTGKLHWLPQGADERVTLISSGSHRVVPLLFTGISRGGTLRQSFVTDMAQTYGAMFKHVEKGVYREQLAELIADSNIVLAPDGPVTHRYWSNRVYNALGFGAFMLHPYCERLAEQYLDEKEIVYYEDRDQLKKLITYYLEHPVERKQIAQNGYERTVRTQLYRHRCEELVAKVKERLCL